ncbi:MAG: helix-turn-helix transcriptional regulator [Sneathiellaceae bacterium]
MPHDDYKEQDAELRTPEGIRRWRDNQGWSRPRLAEELGNTHTAIKYWESGGRPIPVWVPLALAEIQRRYAPKY